MGFAEILTIVFVVLKLLGVISWSWWLVILPEIIALAFYTLLIVVNVCVHVKTSKTINKHFNTIERDMRRWDL